jgi:hypothetical protein
MLSLIYVARVTHSSEELVQGLQSAGLHTKAFAPGEITADECILVMTSEAVLASLQRANGAPTAGHVDRGSEGVPPPPNMNAHLESQAAIWNRLKTAAAKESATRHEWPSSVASKIDSRTENVGFIASEVGLRVLAISQKSADQPLPVGLARPSAKTGNPSLAPPSLASGEKSQNSPAQTAAILFGMASRFSGRSRVVNGPRYKLFWQTVATVASMLIFAALRPSTTEVTAGDTTQSTRLESGSKELRQPVSETRSQQTEVPKAAEAQLRQSDYVVAKDFTKHFTLHAHSSATIQKSDLKRNAQGSLSHIRVVAN